MIGDGQLPHPSSENIVETFYSLRLVEHVTVSANYQYVVYPAYNRDRGPVSIFAIRVHAYCANCSERSRLSRSTARRDC